MYDLPETRLFNLENRCCVPVSETARRFARCVLIFIQQFESDHASVLERDQQSFNPETAFEFVISVPAHFDNQKISTASKRAALDAQANGTERESEKTLTCLEEAALGILADEEASARFDDQISANGSNGVRGSEQGAACQSGKDRATIG